MTDGHVGEWIERSGGIVVDARAAADFMASVERLPWLGTALDHAALDGVAVHLRRTAFRSPLAS